LLLKLQHSLFQIWCFQNIYIKLKRISGSCKNIDNGQFWHHQLKEGNAYRVVLKGPYTNLPKSQIKQGSTVNGFEVLNIYCPKKTDWKNIQVNEGNNDASINYRTRQNFSYVNLEQGSNVAKSLKIIQLRRYRVTVERASRKKELLQCQRCQIFGNSKNYGVLDPVCGKCSGPHVTGSMLCVS